MAAKTFQDIMKFNPYHDSKGRFTSAGSEASFTYAPGKSKAHDLAIERHKERMAAAAPTEAQAKTLKGTYTLRNLNYRTKWTEDQKGWMDMRNDIEAASQEFKTHRQMKKELREPFEKQVKPISDKWAKMRAEGASQEELDKIAKEYTEKWDALKPQLEQAARQAYVDQYHRWYKANAGLYGFEYIFTPTKGKAQKSTSEDEIMEIEKSSGEVVLDRKMREDVDEIVAEILREYPRDLTQKDTTKSFSIFKTDDDKRLVFGWASVSITVDGEQLEDRQKDMIDPEDLEEAVYEYVLNFRDTGEEHIPSLRKKGKLVESCMLTAEKQKAMGIPEGILPIGWWIGFKITDDVAWERVKNGTYKMFSIEGRATREPVEKTIDRRKPVEKSNRYDYIQEVSVAKTFTQILKFNPYHDRLGRFTSAPGGGAGSGAGTAGRSYGTTNTGDAVAEVRGGKTNSLAAHMDADGKLTPEREAVHKKIIDDLLKGKEPVEGQATMTMLGGGPASGKSSVMNPDTSNDKHAVTVDPDAIKHMLPGFKEMAAKDPNAAAFYHEESSALAKRFSEVAYKENYNVIYDGTGDGSNKSVQKKIDAARANGYRIEGKYVSVDTETAVQRNQKRYDDAIARGETPRLPPVDVVRATHMKCTDISVSMASQFDYIEIWDNNGARGQQKMIASGGGGKGLKVVSGQEEAFTRYLNKGAKGAEGFITLPDGQVVPAG